MRRDITAKDPGPEQREKPNYPHRGLRHQALYLWTTSRSQSGFVQIHNKLSSTFCSCRWWAWTRRLSREDRVDPRSSTRRPLYRRHLSSADEDTSDAPRRGRWIGWVSTHRSEAVLEGGDPPTNRRKPSRETTPSSSPRRLLALKWFIGSSEFCFTNPKASLKTIAVRRRLDLEEQQKAQPAVRRGWGRKCRRRELLWDSTTWFGVSLRPLHPVPQCKVSWCNICLWFVQVREIGQSNAWTWRRPSCNRKSYMNFLWRNGKSTQHTCSIFFYHQSKTNDKQDVGRRELTLFVNHRYRITQGIAQPNQPCSDLWRQSAWWRVQIGAGNRTLCSHLPSKPGTRLRNIQEGQEEYKFEKVRGKTLLIVTWYKQVPKLPSKSESAVSLTHPL